MQTVITLIFMQLQPQIYLQFIQVYEISKLAERL